MARVRFTRHLRQFFPDLGECQADGDTVAAVIGALDERWPGIAGYVLDDRGALRHHVNVFVDGEMVEDRRALSDPVGEQTEVFVVQALSGG